MTLFDNAAPVHPFTPCHRVRGVNDSFDEDFKTLVKQTLNDPSLLLPASPMILFRSISYDSEMDDREYYYEMEQHDIRSSSQPIAINWNRSRTHSLDEIDARDMHIQRKQVEMNDWDDESMVVSSTEDECIFAFEM